MDEQQYLQLNNFSMFNDAANYADNATGTGNGRAFSDQALAQRGFPIPRQGTAANVVQQSNVTTAPSPRQSYTAEINMRITNSCTIPVTVELFNYLQSNLYTPRGGWHPGAVTRTISVRNSANTGTLILNVLGIDVSSAPKTVYFSPEGNLVYDPNTDGMCVVSTAETPYRSLFEWTGRNAFEIAKMRMNFSRADQIGQTIEWFNWSFLGQKTSQVKSVQSSKTPDQYQNLLVDFAQPYTIDAEKGLNYTMLAAPDVDQPNVVDITFSLKMWSAPTIR